MTITLEDIRKAFNDLESESRSREEIAAFATAAMKADDQGLLELTPPDEVERIWKAITYLSGVDLMEEPSVYLHSVQNFSDFRMEMGL